MSNTSATIIDVEHLVTAMVLTYNTFYGVNLSY
jgi:hypothetical protein